MPTDSDRAFGQDVVWRIEESGTAPAISVLQITDERRRALAVVYRLSRVISQGDVKWLFRLLHRHTLLKLSKPIEGDAHLNRLIRVFRGGQRHDELFAVGSNVVRPYAAQQYLVDWQFCGIRKCEAWLGTHIDGNQLPGVFLLFYIEDLLPVRRP